jgi:Arc/MetJ family transcription regulator
VRTNIVINGKLIAEAMKMSGARTRREAVENSCACWFS